MVNIHFLKQFLTEGQEISSFTKFSSLASPRELIPKFWSLTRKETFSSTTKILNFTWFCLILLFSHTDSFWFAHWGGFEDSGKIIHQRSRSPKVWPPCLSLLTHCVTLNQFFLDSEPQFPYLRKETARLNFPVKKAMEYKWAYYLGNLESILIHTHAQ